MGHVVHKERKAPLLILDHLDPKDQRDQPDHKDLQDLQDHQPQPSSQLGHIMAEIHLNQHCTTMVTGITKPNQEKTSRLKTLSLLEPCTIICPNLMSLCK